MATSATSDNHEVYNIVLNALLVGWRPWLLGWRPSLAGWRPLLLGSCFSSREWFSDLDGVQGMDVVGGSEHVREPPWRVYSQAADWWCGLSTSIIYSHMYYI